MNEQAGPEMINVTVSEVPGREVKLTGEKGKFTLGEAVRMAQGKGLKLKKKEVKLGEKKVEDLNIVLQDGDKIFFVSKFGGGF